MSSANPVPETWKLTGSDARETLERTGIKRLLRDAFVEKGQRVTENLDFEATA